MAVQIENLTVKQAAREMNLSVRTVRSWISQRRLGYVRLGRSIRIPSTEVRRLIRQGTVRAAAMETSSKTCGVSNGSLTRAVSEG